MTVLDAEADFDAPLRRTMPAPLHADPKTQTEIADELKQLNRDVRSGAISPADAAALSTLLRNLHEVTPSTLAELCVI